ncbi:hypothetical protein CXF59_08085 [Flavobacterium sp. ALD4]|jgi:hypothetical protein|uniref:hypothetical protein n=1 Tax=Flavobacterium sp. ALD4 TaxID=2058314 RepID=UPI000C33F929|nr:hypothetical protein [Flavobacterium sp. ALD4]PKH67362.1 hypothetical protein CXF59_08085 [Flavobacterium sp. ALD4]
MKQTFKLNTNWKNFIVKILLSMTIMTLGFTLISLYIPLKGLISGKSYTLVEFLSYLELRKYLAIIIAVSIAMSVRELRKKTTLISPNNENV